MATAEWEEPSARVSWRMFQKLVVEAARPNLIMSKGEDK